MIEKNPNSWQEFKAVVAEIRETYGYHELPIDNELTYKGKNIILFRGQSCAEWPLRTTLERKIDNPCSINYYITKSMKHINEFESYTGSKWDIGNLPNLRKEIREKSDRLFGPYIPHEDYLIYLRHHGYPSPLLDWSESPYIAAYFAISDITKCHTSEQRAAIYVYIDSTEGGKSFQEGNPIIRVISPAAGRHKRHFIQKAWYTVASKWSEKLGNFNFCSHHEVFDDPNKSHSQDIVIKITLPVSERSQALRDLDDYNINYFTLFQTEDALVKAMGIKDFDIDEY